MGYFLGIDPGKSGAFAFVSADLTDYLVFKYPDTESALVRIIEDTLEDHPVVFAAIERAQAAPMQGRSSIMTYGANYGGWIMLLSYLQISMVTVPPKKWQKRVYGSITRAAELKLASVAHASRMFPRADIGKNHNLADALNIALYARAEFNNG